MSDKCGALDAHGHCCALDADRTHDEHQAWIDGRWLFWPNEAYVSPIDPMKRMRELSHESLKDRMPVNRIHQEERKIS